MDGLSKRLDAVLFEDLDRQILKLVFAKLRESKKGKLAVPIKTGQIEPSDIYNALRKQRCLHTKDYDVGPVYLKSAVAGAIHDAVPEKLINRARSLFGMKPKKPEGSGKFKPRPAYKVPNQYR